jgi:D-beta-D-heptose 7-phosphate kinase/D-beta-D-heptose 1-phosphate adenosyltransferase
VLAGLAAVDLVTSFDETTPARIIDRLKPDVLVKGEDYRDQVVVGRETVEAAGGRVVLAPLWPGVSTTRIIERIRT